MHSAELNVRPERMRATSILSEEKGAQIFKRSKTMPSKAKVKAQTQSSAATDLFLRDPTWTLVVVGGALISVSIFINALFLQRGNIHPAPIWNSQNIYLNAPVPEQSPYIESKVTNSQSDKAQAQTQNLIRTMQIALKERGFYEGDADGVWGKDTDAAMHDFAYAAKVTLPLEPSDQLLKQILASKVTVKDQVSKLLSPTASAQTQDTQIKTAQRALIKIGLGPIDVDGKMGTQTRKAILAFERKRNLPLTGQFSARNLRELSVASGIKISN